MTMASNMKNRLHSLLPTKLRRRNDTSTQHTPEKGSKHEKHKISLFGNFGKMASSGRSEQTHVVTKTVKTMGPDGKMHTQTVKEETKVIRKGGETTTTTTTTTEGGPKTKDGSAQPKKPLLGGLFKKKEHKTTTAQHRDQEYDDVGGLCERTAQLSIDSNAQGSSGTAGKNKVSLEEFRKRALDKHNEYRAMHGAKPLKLNSQLNKYAQEWAERMAKTGTFSHRPDHRYGENIYYGMNSRGISAEDAVSSWYNEVKNYNFSSPGFRSGTGHFTQVVWKGSHELGIGMAEGKPGHIYVVGNYNPAGNVQGDFDVNVSPQKSVVLKK